MQHALTISKGNQYSRNGYNLTDKESTLTAYGEARPDGKGVYFEGGYFPSDDAEKAMVTGIILQVLADGQTRTLVIGEATAEENRPEWQSPRGLTLSEEMSREDTPY